MFRQRSALGSRSSTCNRLHIIGNQSRYFGVCASLTMPPRLPVRTRKAAPDAYFAPITSLAIVCSCMFDVPS